MRLQILCWCLHKTTKGASDKKESSAFIKLDYLLTFEALVVQKLTACHLPNLPEEGTPDHVLKTHLKTNIEKCMHSAQVNYKLYKEGTG